MHPTKLVHVDDAALAQIQTLEKAAQSAVTQSNTKFLIGGVAVFGLLVAPLSLPAAAMVAAPLVLIAVKRAVTSGAAAAYMKESGNFAPLLNDRQLLKLTSLVGKQTVLDQLQEALEDGQYLSGSALDYLEHCGINTTPPDLKAELEAYDQRQQQAAAVKTIHVTAQTVEEANLLDDEAATVAQTADSSDIAPVSLIEAIAADPSSLFLSAPVRTGKGVLLPQPSEPPKSWLSAVSTQPSSRSAFGLSPRSSSLVSGGTGRPLISFTTPTWMRQQGCSGAEYLPVHCGVHSAAT
jgi:hypothetical protein